LEAMMTSENNCSEARAHLGKFITQ
jgi:hypothetical protein